MMLAFSRACAWLSRRGTCSWPFLTEEEIVLQQFRALTEQSHAKEVICIRKLPRLALRSAPQRQKLWRRSERLSQLSYPCPYVAVVGRTHVSSVRSWMRTLHVRWALRGWACKSSLGFVQLRLTPPDPGSNDTRADRSPVLLSGNPRSCGALLDPILPEGALVPGVRADTSSFTPGSVTPELDARVRRAAPALVPVPAPADAAAAVRLPTDEACGRTITGGGLAELVSGAITGLRGRSTAQPGVLAVRSDLLRGLSVGRLAPLPG